MLTAFKCVGPEDNANCVIKGYLTIFLSLDESEKILVVSHTISKDTLQCFFSAMIYILFESILSLPGIFYFAGGVTSGRAIGVKVMSLALSN
ncbi:hypothetical protein [Serratia proteamaculans]